MRVDGRRRKFGETDARIVRLVGRMPFVASDEVWDLLELPDEHRTERVMRRLEAMGYLTSVKSSDVMRQELNVVRQAVNVPVYCLTRQGIRRLAGLDGIDGYEVYERYPVSLQWRRALLRRMEALDVFYWLCRYAALARKHGAITFDEDDGGSGDGGQPSGETLFWWRKTGWLDGTIMFGTGEGARGIRVLRTGPSRVRRAVLSRLGSMMESWRERGVERVIIVVPGYTELIYVEQWLRENGRTIQAFCMVEHRLKGEILEQEEGMFRRPHRYGSDQILFVEGLSGLRGRRSAEGDALDAFEPDSKPILPPGAMLKNVRSDRAVLVGATLKRRERICLQAVSDWPLALRGHLLGLKDVSERAFKSLFDMGLILYAWDDRRARVLLSDDGMRYVANRDRSSLGELNKKWGYDLLGKAEPELKNLKSFPVKGKGLRKGQRVRAEGGKLMTVSRQLAHLDGTNEFFCALGAGTQGFDVVEVLPTHRGERWAKIRGKNRAILPDGSFVAKTPEGVEPFAVEFERRAVDSPKAMAKRLQPYKNYYDAVRMFGDYGKTTLTTLFVFETVEQASRLASVCMSNRYLAQTSRGRQLPVYVSSLEAMREDGIWSKIWFAVGGQYSGQYVVLTDRG